MKIIFGLLCVVTVFCCKIVSSNAVTQNVTDMIIDDGVLEKSKSTINTTPFVLLDQSTIKSISNLSVENVLDSNDSCGRGCIHCSDGLLLSMWMPQHDLSVGTRAFRGFIYFLILCYLFLGVSIVCDRFMAGIEVITSSERKVKIRKPNGEKEYISVRVWNGTVANLTLMAFGSSAPEILLSIIEVFSKHFEAGELGPGTIVGSAAYNLFCITALCVFVVPDGQVKKIKFFRVFIVTASISIFAYIWMYIILAVSSPGVVEVWEGFITFLMFPLTVYFAYVADRRLFFYKYLSKEYRRNRRGNVVIKTEITDVVKKNIDGSGGVATEEENMLMEEVKEFEEARREYITTLMVLRDRYPQHDLEDLEIMAQEQLINKGLKSRAFYRIQATRKMMGSGNILKRISERAQTDLTEVKAELLTTDVDDLDDSNIARIYFDPGHYSVMENCGSFDVRIVRRGNISTYVTVQYETEEGSAEADTDFVSKRGTLIFLPGICEQRLHIDIIDNELFEQDEHFYVKLIDCSNNAMLVTPKIATIMILDDDHCGIFGFTQKEFTTTETCGRYELRVQRYSGVRGKVRVPFWTENGSGKAGKDYEPLKGELIFENNATEKIIPLVILEEGSYEKDVLFYVNLGEPQMVGDELANAVTEAEAKAPEDLTEQDKMALLGRPKAGDITRAQLRIKESKEFKNTVDKLVQRANASLLIGTSSWKEQFTEALTVSAGDDGENDGEEPSPSCGDYIMHFLTVFWKIIFAFIPPTDIYSGYLCFGVSIICIGVVTAIIGDVASHFGCTLGIKDSVTAIVFVALGTSIPDTFASKVAAIQDKYADASVGNVTGSNAVNVFLGIGVAWTIAAVYHFFNGTTFNVDPGSLAFSVTLFCTEACFAVAILLARRSKSVGGELGGPKTIKVITSITLFGLWIIYLVISTLEAYGVIKGF